MTNDPILEGLIALSRSLGSDRRQLAILAEGNVSAVIDDGSFWVKASGMQMGEASEKSFVRVKFEKILGALSSFDISDGETKALLSGSRVDVDDSLMPSVETFMHAYLLQLPGVRIVGHTHPTALISLLALEDAAEFALLRLFPDDVVCCGPESAFVPYVDPGLPLARSIKTSVEGYVSKWGAVPKTIWLQNHGLIALGRSRQEVESATFMAAKSAEALGGALSTHRKLKPLNFQQIERIHNRPDEHYRQKLLFQIKAPLKS